MDADILKIMAEASVGGIALFMFYKIITNELKEHRSERKSDAELWRKEIKEGREDVNKVVNKLEDVIRDINS